MDFIARSPWLFGLVHPQDQMAVSGTAVILVQLISRQVPVCVEPVGIAGGEQEAFGPVGFGQFLESRAGRRGGSRCGTFFAGRRRLCSRLLG